MRIAFGIAAIGLALAGCGLSGGATAGDEGRSTWSIDDGLCPGLGGDCAMTVPVAAGSDPHVDVHVDRREVNELSVRVTGPGSVFELDRDTQAERIDVDLEVDGPGTVEIELLDAAGDRFDASRLDVREAVDLECGVLEDGGADWEMSQLTVTDSFEEVGTSGAPQVELGCRLLDANGEPLLSARAIEWTVLESQGDFTLGAGGFGGPRGARVYARFDRRGDGARVRASFGGLTRELALTTAF